MTQIGNTYGQALYDLAREEGLSTRILEQLQVLEQAFAQEPEFLRLLGAPNLPKEERCQLLDDGFRGRIEPYVLNFLKLMTEKGYVRSFSDCCHVYRELYNADHGILPVRAVCAVALTSEQEKKLTDKLSSLTGKTIQLTTKVDPSVLGGMRLDYDGKRVDGTVQSRLQALHDMLKNTQL